MLINKRKLFSLLILLTATCHLSACAVFIAAGATAGAGYSFMKLEEEKDRKSGTAKEENP